MAELIIPPLLLHQHVHILAVAACVGAIGFVIIRYFLASKRDGWHTWAARSLGAGIGLDAAEKGDTDRSWRSLAEEVPYDLEKRAIMHKRWLMVAHDSEFSKPGDYRTYTIADIPFLIIRGKDDNKLRAFHNVCRHRAYMVARKTSGNSGLLSCKYHGWQYESTGRLFKAPEFMDKPGFDMSTNGLFEIHLRIDSGRFVFVNFATELADAFPWSDISSPSLQSLKLVDTIAWEVVFNVSWRIASLLPWFLNPLRLTTSSWQHTLVKYLAEGPSSSPRLQYVDDTSFICCLGSGCFLLVSALPLDATNTVVKITYIAAPGMSPPSNMQNLVNIEITSALSMLKKHQPPNTNLDFRQSAIRERLDKFARHIDQHRRLEKAARRLINPAVRVTGHASEDREAEFVCNALENAQGPLGAACPVARIPDLEW
ncbi:Rieske [2Fe-2S] iron-sulfur domain-containing protein [Pseudomassariella vexata]|uniref:Rieske [2Fe-2S] iron-sulfur domain-containing protein n=1 Tax=Pseudomassariella vexata TaxID=1141098 RepID=A0A1Y2DT58_9PEZI|nr:Rieske [2Fe-2S] iron-sulfur domain-containing protein [Pseudomassariella vexata]ORY62458.1 Rieske [2Fe-2S] iron-sulfur domain-containing protein [Pseudomassariella vexata]